MSYAKSFHSFSIPALSSACAAVLLAACGGGSATDEGVNPATSYTASAAASLGASPQGLANRNESANSSDATTDAAVAPVTDVTTDTADTPVTDAIADASAAPAADVTVDNASAPDTVATAETTTTDGVASLSAGTVLSTSTYSGAYHLYVSTTGLDTNPGTRAAPLRTIPKAASLAKPGTVVHVAPGTYAGTINTRTSGTATANIVYVSDVKWGAKLIPASSTSASTAWQVSGNYIVVDGFDIDGQSSGGWRRGLSATGSYVTFKDNHVHHVAQRASCDSNGGGGITVDGYYGAHHHTVLNNVVHHVGPAGCHWYHGIYVASFDYTAKNNLTHNNSGVGIFGNHDSGRGQIINNTVFRNSKGILVSGNDFIKISAAGPFIIENNVVYDNNAGGTRAGNIAGIGIYGKQVSGSRIANNYTYNNRDIELYMVSGAGSISGNLTTGAPGFVNYQISGSGNYHLTATSQLVNKGIATRAPAYDLDGIARPQGGGIDLGSYEYKVQ